MDTVTAPALTLQDLDRDELLLLVSRCGLLRPRDLWGVRWRVLADRASAAGKAMLSASALYDDAAAAVTALSGKPGRSVALSAARQRREAAWTAYRAASAKSDRAEKAADRAWKALSACDGRVEP